MFGGTTSPSLADIAAVTDNNNEGFGGNNGWWILIILFVLFGWGRGGYGENNGGATTVIPVPTSGGYFGSNSASFTDAAIQRGFDNQAVISKLDGINNGICNLGYDQLSQMNGINSNIMQTGFGIQQAINNDTVANMQNTNALSRQVDNCCCENRAALADIKYTMATESCATNNNIHQTGDAIIQNQTQGFQMLNNTIKDGFCNLEMREMTRENANLRQQLNDCSRDSALQGTASYIINSINPPAVPAFPARYPSWNDCDTGCNCNASRCQCNC